MEKVDIKSREDLHLLVYTFYEKIKIESTLGPIFIRAIKDWPTHIDHITDFWQSQLLFTKRYRGNPAEVHVRVDKNENHSISPEHFGIWLNLWFATIDELFEGEISERAKRNARKMNTHLFLKIWEARKEA